VEVNQVSLASPNVVRFLLIAFWGIAYDGDVESVEKSVEWI
jgi:hypothetical protein